MYLTIKPGKQTARKKTRQIQHKNKFTSLLKQFLNSNTPKNKSIGSHWENQSQAVERQYQET